MVYKRNHERGADETRYKIKLCTMLFDRCFRGKFEILLKILRTGGWSEEHLEPVIQAHR